jgi:hypothetical protein
MCCATAFSTPIAVAGETVDVFVVERLGEQSTTYLPYLV